MIRRVAGIGRWLFSWPGLLLPILFILGLYSVSPYPLGVFVDGSEYWGWAWRTAAGDYGTLELWWQTRWFILAVSTFAIRLLGDGLTTYYLITLFNTFALLVVMSFLVSRAFGPWYVPAYLFLFLLQVDYWRLSLDMLPSSFLYLSFAGFALSFYWYRVTGAWWWIIAAVIALYTMGASRITHYFFLPGLGLVLLIRREYRFLLALVIGFPLMYALETLYFQLLTDGNFPLLGRFLYLLERPTLVSSQRDNTSGLRFIDLFVKRWGELNYPARFSYFAFFLAGPVYLIWDRLSGRFVGGEAHSDEGIWRGMMQAFVAMGLSFALMNTFFVNSLDPLSVAIAFIDRYLAGLLPIAHFGLLWLIAWGLSALAQYSQRALNLVRLALIALALSVAGVLGTLFSGIPFYSYPVETTYNMWEADAYFEQVVADMTDGACFRVEFVASLDTLQHALTPAELDTINSAGVALPSGETPFYEEGGAILRQDLLFEPMFHPPDALETCDEIIDYGALTRREFLKLTAP
jgi:hypothetical protein